VGSAEARLPQVVDQRLPSALIQIGANGRTELSRKDDLFETD